MGMSIEEALTALTLNGAAALGLADTIGSIEPGKSQISYSSMRRTLGILRIALVAT